MASVEVSNVCRRFGSYLAADNMDLTVGEGEFVALVGPSGCGKSTLLRMIAGLDTPDEGAIRIAGREVSHTRPSDRDVAMVFQNYALYPHLTVRQNIATPLSLRRLRAWERMPLLWRLSAASRARRAGIDASVMDAARSLGLEALLERKPAALSGGQRQRVALGRAIVRQPAVFLYDEPLSNLDAELRASMRTEIVELHRRLGVATVYVTHDQVEAMTMADRIAVMRAGKILQFGTPSELYNAPSCLEVAKTIGTPRIGLLSASVSAAGGLRVAGTMLPISVALPSGAKVTVGIRAEHLRPAVPAVPAVPAMPHSLIASVVTVEYLGSDTLVHVDLPSEGKAQSARLIARAAESQIKGLTTGSRVNLHIDFDHILVFDEAGKRIDHTAAQSGLSRHLSYA